MDKKDDKQEQAAAKSASAEYARSDNGRPILIVTVPLPKPENQTFEWPQRADPAQTSEGE